MHESQGIVRLIVTLSEYDLATEQRETALSSQAEIYIIGGLLRRDCPEVVGHHLDRQPDGVGGEAARLLDRRSLGILENPREGGFT